MEKCRLFAWGANSHGQLGLGYESEQSVLPEEIDLTKANIMAKDIIKIVGGAGHTLLLVSTGRVYSCGWNKKGQTGIPQDDGIIPNFQTIDALKNVKIKDIACGWDSSIALDANGHVYTWGSNTYGQLGRSTREPRDFTSAPDKVEISARVKRIAMGLRHTLLLTEEGRLLVSGAGSKCQLGIIDENDDVVRQTGAFFLVPGIFDVREIACGQYFSMAITESGDIYSWGNNKYGQLGFDFNGVKSWKVPVKLTEKIGEIEGVYCGWTHAGVLTTEGRIFCWGRNTYGQLGNAEGVSSWRPRALQNLEKMQQLSIGSEHNIALDSEGRIVSWGWNEHGNCGNGSTENVLIPQKISISKDFKGVLIGSGAGHSFAVVEDLI